MKLAKHIPHLPQCKVRVFSPLIQHLYFGGHLEFVCEAPN